MQRGAQYPGVEGSSSSDPDDDMEPLRGRPDAAEREGAAYESSDSDPDEGRAGAGGREGGEGGAGAREGRRARARADPPAARIGGRMALQDFLRLIAGRMPHEVSSSKGNPLPEILSDWESTPESAGRGPFGVASWVLHRPDTRVILTVLCAVFVMI